MSSMPKLHRMMIFLPWRTQLRQLAQVTSELSVCEGVSHVLPQEKPTEKRQKNPSVLSLWVVHGP